ncbi:hypothetical protein O0L34_g19351 [Tuta absoluta]|nr:hypothetical protein O0L34_g19351 [Tuta absoluta]
MSGEKPLPGYLPGLGKPRHERSRSPSPASEQTSRSRSSSTGSSSQSGDSLTSPNYSHGSEQLSVSPAAPAKAQEHLPGTIKNLITTPTDPPAPSGGMLPRRSPRTEHEFNVLMCERLRASGYVSKGLLEHIATYQVDEEKVTKSDPTPPTPRRRPSWHWPKPQSYLQRLGPHAAKEAPKTIKPTKNELASTGMFR